MNTRLVRNVAWNVGAQLALLVLSLTLLRTVFRGVGGDTVGLLYFALLVSNVTASLSEVGLGSAVVREVSGSLERDPGGSAPVLRTFSSVYWAGFALLAAGLWALAPQVAERWLQGEAPAATAEIRLLGVGALLAFPRSLYLNVLRGAQRVDLSSQVEMASAVVQQAGGLLVVGSGRGRGGLFLWWAASFAVGLLLAMWAAGRVAPRGALRPGWSAEVARRNAGYTSRMLSVGLISLAQTHLDKLVLSRLSPLSSLGAYGYGFAFVTKGGFFGQAVGQAALPSMAQLHAEGRVGELRALDRKVHDLICYASLPAFAAVPFLTIPVFGAVFDGAVARELLVPLALLALAFYLGATLQSLGAVALATGRADITLRFNVYALLLVGPLTVVLVHRYGITGAGLSWVAYFLLALAYSVPRLVTECLHGRPQDWYSRLALVVVAGAIAYGPGLWAAERFGFAPLPSLLAYAGSSVAFALCAWRLMGPGPRQWIREQLERRGAAAAGAGG